MALGRNLMPGNIFADFQRFDDVQPIDGGSMLLNTRRRAIGLILAGAAALRLPPLPRARAKTADCFANQPILPWIAIATNTQAGAKIDQVIFVNPDKCDLLVEVQVSASFEGKLVIYGDQQKTRLPKKFLIQPDNRLMVRNANGELALDEPLCGVCTDIHDDKVSIVLPLACAPLFQSEREIEVVIKLGTTEECHFALDCINLRKALDWAVAQRGMLAEKFEAQTCTPPQGCFITTACCDVLGLPDNCFELRALRRYRNEVLAKTPDGRATIALYYALAPALLNALEDKNRAKILRKLYARFIFPSALAAQLGFNRLAFRLYARMMQKLSAQASPQSSRHGAPVAV